MRSTALQDRVRAELRAWQQTRPGEPGAQLDGLLKALHRATGPSGADHVPEGQAAPVAPGDALAQALAEVLQLTFLSTSELEACDAQEADFSRVPVPEAIRRDCLILTPTGDSRQPRRVVLGNPLDTAAQDWLQSRLDDGRPLVWRVADIQAVRDALARHAAQARKLAATQAPDALLDDKAVPSSGSPADAGAVVLSLVHLCDDPSPVVRTVNATLFDALQDGASDVHLLRTAAGLQVRYRVDGVLGHAASVEGRDMAEQMISRLKVLSDLDIAERRVPQDGKFQVRFENRTVDIRVSIMPTLHGEAAVLRLLDTRTVLARGHILRLDDLGFDAGTLTHLRRLVALPYGMVLVTGPTGSGKTTTLYAAISEIHQGNDHFLTIEDPIEYELPEVEQIPVNDRQGLTFARGLRSILRHDPDRIMVGEIRDRETAEMAVQAALTGHAVYSTLHANHAVDVFSRLLYMGLDAHALTSALNGIWAQRLVRTNCPHCVRAYAPDGHVLATLNGGHDRTREGFAAPNFRRGAGYRECRGTGFRGRVAVAEVVMMDDALRELVVARAPIGDLKRAARAAGIRFLRDAAWALAREGRTTVEEVLRVTMAA